MISITGFEDFCKKKGFTLEDAKKDVEVEDNEVGIHDDDDDVPLTTYNQRKFLEFDLKTTRKKVEPLDDDGRARRFKNMINKIKGKDLYKDGFTLLLKICVNTPKILCAVLNDKRYAKWDPFETGLSMFYAIKKTMKGTIDVAVERSKKNEEYMRKNINAIKKARKHGRVESVPVRIENHNQFSIANCLILILFQTKRFLRSVMQYRPNLDVMTEANRMANYFCNTIQEEIGEEIDKSLKIRPPEPLPKIEERMKIDPRSVILKEKPPKPKIIRIQKLRRYGVKLIQAMQKLFAFMLKGNDFEQNTSELLENIIDCETFEKYDFKGKNHNAMSFYNSFWMTFEAGFELNKNVN
jgi:hypothetical protein